MAGRRHWLVGIGIVALLVGCGSGAAPSATAPGAATATLVVPAASPTISSAAPRPTDTIGSPVAPTRTVSGVVPTIATAPASDTLYVDPQGRFAITVPRDWQLRAPANPASTVLVSFDAPDMLASLTITLESVPLGTTAKDFATSTDKAIASKMANYKKQGQDSLTVGNVPAEALTYQGAAGNKDYLFRQILIAQGVDGWSITFPLDPGARQRYGPVIDTITQSFVFGRPLGAAAASTALASTKVPVSSAPAPSGTPAAIIKFPSAAVDWKPNMPVSAGVPVRLADAGIIAQLNGGGFTTKTTGKAILGPDEQFFVADITIWNTGGTDVVPLPEQFNVAQERGMTFVPETADIAGDLVGSKVPPFGKIAIAPGAGMHGAIVVRVPRQGSLLIISYQPGTTSTPQPAQFYVKQ